MLDLKFIRENTELVRQAVANRQDSTPIDEILKLDALRRQKLLELEDLRHARKELAKERKAEDKGRKLRARIKVLEEELRNLDGELKDLLLQVPNVPQASVPIGKDESDNVVVRSWGELPKFDFEPVPHWKLGEDLGIIDFERGVKLSGTRFYVLKGLGSRLQRALINFMLDLHTNEHGYQEMYPPFMV